MVDPEQLSPSSPGYLLLGVGAGGLSGVGDQSMSQGIAVTFQMGYRLTPRLQLGFSGDYLTFARFSKHHAQQQANVSLGVRYFLLGPEYAGSSIGVFPRHLYARAGLGVGHAILIPYESFDPREVQQGAFGPATTLGIGWMPVKMRGGSLGLEIADTIVFYAGGRRHNWGANLTIQLDIL